MDRFVLGRAVRSARESRGLTLREAAALSGLTYGYIQQIEEPREQTNVTMRALEKLLPALGIELVAVSSGAAAGVDGLEPAHRALVERAAVALASLPAEELEQEARILELRAARHAREPAATESHTATAKRA